MLQQIISIKLIQTWLSPGVVRRARLLRCILHTSISLLNYRWLLIQLSSADSKVDEKVDFEVLEDVKIGDVVVIQHGAMAIATVTEAHPKRSMGRAGKLNMNIDYVQLVNGEKVPLRSVKGGSGGTHTAAMTGAMVATAIVFFPAAPLFLFIHGKNITIPKGTEITAYVAADTPLDASKFA